MLASGEVRSRQRSLRSPRRQALTIITNIIYADQDIFRWSDDVKTVQSRDNLFVGVSGVLGAVELSERNTAR